MIGFDRAQLLAPMLEITQRMGCGAVLIDSNSKIIAYNNAAVSIICNYTSESAFDDNSIKRGIKSLLSQSDNRFILNKESWAVINKTDTRPIALHSIPSTDGIDKYIISLIVIIDLSEDRAPSNEALYKMFGLTTTEANIAIQISKGKTLAEISKENGTTLWTVRSQLASIFGKTQTKRQSELVALLLKVSMLS